MKKKLYLFAIASLFATSTMFAQTSKTFVIDAGCSFSSAFVSFNTLPVDASIKMLDLALSSRSSALTISGIIIRQINRNNFFT